MDCRDGYFHIKVKEKDREKTAFSTGKGLYEYTCLPFGCTYAPSFYQRVMTNLLKEFNQFCTCYLDDVVIIGDNFDNHKENVSKVLEKF